MLRPHLSGDPGGQSLPPWTTTRCRSLRGQGLETKPPLQTILGGGEDNVKRRLSPKTPNVRSCMRNDDEDYVNNDGGVDDGADDGP